MDKTLFLPIVILLLITILFVLVSLNKKRFNTTKKTKLLENLFSLKVAVESDEISIRRDAVIKLDNLLTKALQMYYGNTLSCGENLKSANKMFRKKAYNSLWDVHKLRNKVVHNDYEVSKDEARNAFETYKISIIKILQ